MQKMLHKRSFGHPIKARASTIIDTEDDDADTTTSSSTAKTTSTSSVTTSSTTTASSTSTVTSASTTKTSTTSSTKTTTSTSTSTTKTSSSTTSTSATSTSSSTSKTSSTSASTLTTSSSALITTSSASRAVVTETVSSSHVSSASAAAASASSTSTSSSGGVSTLGMVAIAGAAIIGAALLVGSLMFIVRRFGKRRDDEFDADEFKDQSVVLNEDNYAAAAYGSRGGSGPRPPTMFERHNETIASFARPDFGYQQDPVPGHAYDAQQNPFSDFNSPSLAQGLYMQPNYSMSPGYQAPYLNGAVHSPAYGDEMYNLNRSPSNGTPAILSRGNSVAQNEMGEYADLSRASVTPFQAAQYEAISKQLNIPVPHPLPRVNEGPEAGFQDSVKGKHDSANATSKPFELPTPNPFEEGEYSSARASSDLGHGQAQDVVIPDSLKPRSAAKPPTLPEIPAQHPFTPLQDSFSMSSTPAKVSLDTPPSDGRISPKDMPQLSPVASSPQLAQLTPNDHEGRETPVQIEYMDGPHTESSVTQPKAYAPSTVTAVKAQRPIRPATVYDDEDAYGGM